MKKIIAFAVGTAALLAIAIGVQAYATTGHDEDHPPPPAAASTESPTPSDSSATPPDGSTSGSADGGTKEDEGEREGFTEDHSGKPGENKP